MNRSTATCFLAIAVAFSFVVSASFAQPESGKQAKPFPKTANKGKAGPALKKSPTAKKKSSIKEKPSADQNKKPKVVDTKEVAQWKLLDKRRAEIGEELEELKIKFSVASRANKLKFKKQFEELLDEWNTKVEPEMEKLAFHVLEMRPDDGMALGMVRESNRYAKIAELTEKLIGKGHDRHEIVRAAYEANFRRNEFKRARDILEAAAKKSDLRFDDVERLDDAKKHEELWKKEVQIRAAEAKAPPEKRLPRVRIETNRGVIEAVLFENEAPNTVANFISLIDEKKFYDGVRFHHVDDDKEFRDIDVDALTGHPDTKEGYDPRQRYGLGDAGYRIKCECFEKNARLRFRGCLIMHHFGLRDSGGSQFAFVRRTEPKVNLLEPDAVRSRTVFGYVVKGMNVMDALQKDDTIKSISVQF